MQFLVLTAEQAADARYDDGNKALAPIPLTDGRFILPLTVLGDHGERNALLDGLPREEIDPDMFPSGDE